MNMNMTFACWRISQHKTAKEWGTLSCETTLLFLLFFFSFRKYLIIKDFFQVSKNKKKNQTTEKRPFNILQG